MYPRFYQISYMASTSSKKTSSIKLMLWKINYYLEKNIKIFWEKFSSKRIERAPKNLSESKKSFTPGIAKGWQLEFISMEFYLRREPWTLNHSWINLFLKDSKHQNTRSGLSILKLDIFLIMTFYAILGEFCPSLCLMTLLKKKTSNTTLILRRIKRIFKHLNMFWVKGKYGKEKKDKHCQEFFGTLCSFRECCFF